MDSTTLVVELPVLETRCRICDGAGGHEERDRWCRCGSCGGVGYYPTEAGEQVLALMRHNFRAVHDRMEEERGWEDS